MNKIAHLLVEVSSTKFPGQSRSKPVDNVDPDAASDTIPLGEAQGMRGVPTAKGMRITRGREKCLM